MKITQRKDDWIQTYTGRAFYLLDPRVEDIDILDIAHALALENRYAGHTCEPYSVAQHCVLASRIVPAKDALWALLHDAPEAYIRDIPRPLKPFLGEYRAIERRIMIQVCARFDLTYAQPESIDEADLILLRTEQRDLMGAPPMPWRLIVGVQPLDEIIVPWGWQQAQAEFFSCFEQLIHAEALLSGTADEQPKGANE